MSIDQYSTTPSNNDLPNYFNTGMRPSAVKTAGWDIMADLCQLAGPGSLVTSGGSANAQTITNTRQVGALYTGRIVEFIPGFTNTGAMTLSEDGLAAKNVFANGASAIAGMVVSGVIARCRYDGTNYQLLNPQRSTGSFTITLTGMSSATTGTVNYAIGVDGKTVFIRVNTAINNTSNATTMTGTGVPAVLSSTTAGQTICAVRDSGTNYGNGSCTYGTTTWTFGNQPYSAAFSGSANKGLPVSTFSYTLD